MDSLETIIRRYVKLPNRESGTGWFAVLCKVCDDHGRKGPRGGFRFDQNKVAYHCFNCGHSIVYDPDTHNGMPEKMVQVLRAFNVPDDEWKALVFHEAAKKHTGGSTQTKQKAPVISSVEPARVPLPDHFYPLAGASPNDKWAQLAYAYLEHDRGIDPTSYGFMLANPTGDPKLDKWLKRVIIPIYKDNTLIFYVGRDLTGKATLKYLSPSLPKEKILYGYEELFRETDEPLYITEGWFDAFAINGVAILGNEISDAHATWLNRSQRSKVYIPDRFGDGQLGAERALSLGWAIATPGINTWADEIKDMNDAVMKYGKMFVMKELAASTATDFAARVNLGLYCKNDTTNKSIRKKKDSAASTPQRTRS